MLGVFTTVATSTAAARLIHDFPIPELMAEAGLEAGPKFAAVLPVVGPFLGIAAQGFGAMLTTALVGIVADASLRSGAKPIRGDGLRQVRRDARIMAIVLKGDLESKVEEANNTKPSSFRKWVRNLWPFKKPSSLSSK